MALIGFDVLQRLIRSQPVVSVRCHGRETRRDAGEKSTGGTVARLHGFQADLEPDAPLAKRFTVRHSSLSMVITIIVPDRQVVCVCEPSLGPASAGNAVIVFGK